MIGKIKLNGVVIDCKDAKSLSSFYAKLLGWHVLCPDDEWTIVHGETPPGLIFQETEGYVPPVWPEEPGAQQQMMHLDFSAEDIPAATRYAISLGATLAPKQFSEHWNVLLDPEGHPFCLVPPIPPAE